MKRIHRRRLISLLAVVMLITIGVGVIAQSVRYPTYLYYGKVLTVDEFLARVEADLFTSCTELPSVERYLDERSTNVDYICFDTLEETYAYIDSVIQPEYERLAKTYPNVKRITPADRQAQN